MLKDYLRIVCFVLAVFSFNGCYTIKPLSAPDTKLLEQVPAINQSLALVMESSFRQYQKKDNGNMLSPSQNYVLGEPMTSLAESYFRKSFRDVKVYEQTPDQATLKSFDRVIKLEISDFDNKLLSLGAADKQTIALQLRALIYDNAMHLKTTVRGPGTAEGWITTGESTQDSQVVVGAAIQNALVNLIKEIKQTN